LTTFPDIEIEPSQMATAAAEIAKRRIKRMTIERIAGVAVAESPLGTALTDAGFTVGYKGMSLPGS